AVADLAAANELIARLIGRAHYKIEEVAEQGANTSFFTALGEDAKLELVSSTRIGSPIDKFITKRGPGLHHLAFEVEDIRVEMQRLEADGFELLQEEPKKGADNKLICFLHPRSTNGVLVEICQSIPSAE
ncbi:MAG: VOC family protein, partial [Bacteroidota bacterium]